MGLFSFLTGGKKDKAKAAKAVAAPAKPLSIEVQLKAAADPVSAVASGAGLAQAKLRLKLSASLRAGQHAAAYEAAKGLADIQARAGRRTGARVWREQAERIKARAA